MRLATIGALASAVILGSSVISSAQDQTSFGLDASVIEAAKKEGIVSLYTAQTEDLTKRTVDAFHKVFPDIEIKSLRPGASGVLVNRYIQEVRSGVFNADVINAQATQIFTDNRDWFLPLTPEFVPTLKSVNPKYVYGNYVATLQAPLIFAYNSKLMPAEDVPKNWLDVINPKYKGQGLIPDPRNSDVYVNWLDMLQQKYGDDYLTKLKDMNLRMVPSGVQGAQEIAAGGKSALFMVGLFPSHVLPVIRRGAPVTMVKTLFKGSGMPTLQNVNFFALPKNAPHPNAARVYMTWLLTQEAQKANCGGIESSLLLPNNDRGDCQESDTDDFISADKQPDPARKAHILELLGLK
jgi:iron(III) transport system substrate-binding protein